jgi:large subunit ribosomal protein L3
MKNKKRAILLLGRKVGMTQLYDESGRWIAVTAIRVDSCPVAQVKTMEKDGYNAVQIAAHRAEGKTITRAMAGHCKKCALEPHSKGMELRVDDASTYQAGEHFDLSLFQEGDKLDVFGTTKGRGFQGVMKRYGFSGGPASHGSMFHRRGGSYGQREEPGRIYPGRKMPGHMGAVKRTVQNLKVVRVFPDKGLLFVKGSIIGPNGNWVAVRTAKKG